MTKLISRLAEKEITLNNLSLIDHHFTLHLKKIIQNENPILHIKVACNMHSI